jgi:hypothetical protein
MAWRETQPGRGRDLLSAGWRDRPAAAKRESSPGLRGSPAAAPPFGGRGNGSFGFMFGRW